MMKILIVEDDYYHANRYAEALMKIGAKCEVSRTLQDAMALVLRSRFDLIILDLFLPDGNTISLSDYVRMRHPDTALLSVTGSTVFSRGEHIDTMSSDYLLRKPVKIDELVEIVTYLCRTRPQVDNDGCTPSAGVRPSPVVVVQQSASLQGLQLGGERAV